MPIDYPASLDTLTNPGASDTLDSPSHSGQHATANDILEALEVKVGTGASVPTNVGDVLTVTGAGATAYQAPSGGIPTASVTLSSADILDLHNTFPVLLASPGPGKFISPKWFEADSGVGTTAYTNGSYTGVVVSWGEGDVYAVEDLGALTTSTGDRHQLLMPSDDARTIGSIADKAMHVYIDDPFTDGDFSLTVTVWYSVVDVP